MVCPILCKDATKADADATLKRSVLLVNTKEFVYYRKAGVNEDDVPLKCIASAGKKWYGKFKNNEKAFPPNFEAEVEKEQTWLSLIFKKLQEQRQPDWAER